MMHRWVRSFPPGQLLRYLVVGAWNTFFGYGCYALLTYVLTGLMPYAYMAAGLLSTVINITVSYLGYKVFVFKTKGNYLREYLRCYVVYGTTGLLGLALLPLLVAVLNCVLSQPVYSPYVAGALLTVVSVVASFLGHRNYSFASVSTPAAVGSRSSVDGTNLSAR